MAAMVGVAGGLVAVAATVGVAGVVVAVATTVGVAGGLVGMAVAAAVVGVAGGLVGVRVGLAAGAQAPKVNIPIRAPDKIILFVRVSFSNYPSFNGIC
ncbi:MAG: hypothetical protein HYX88_02735 [Chloroflexi bacterium]|nr:hypothetical protein [Chloroflexota bacterium]